MKISKIIPRVFVITLAMILVVGVFEVSAIKVDRFGCTDILVGKRATMDGSTIGTYTCDGALYAKLRVVPAQKYKPGTLMPVWFRPFPYNYQQYLDYLENPVLIGHIPQVRRTYRYISIEVWYDDQRVGGINEYGLTTGETTIGGREELINTKGLLFAYSNLRATSLLTLSLERAKTSREAISVMGDLAEEYGFGQPYGEHITVSDGNEVWAFEIFGPGPNWEPGSDKPGAVWCAQRVPDGHVGVSANRSRIGEIDLNNPDYFAASPNVKSLALEMGWWDGTEPFIWYNAYAPSDNKRCQLREWRVLSLAAPSLGLDPSAKRYPFSVKPDKHLTVQDVMVMHRDAYEGTEFDITEDPSWYLNSGEKSPMANPHGPRELHELLELNPERVIATSASVMSYVSQVHADRPSPIKGCMWFGFGPPQATCYVPVYSGVTRLPSEWGQTSLDAIGYNDAWWAFNLVERLGYIKWQNTIADVMGVRNPAEAAFFNMQPEFESYISKLCDKRRYKKARRMVNKYSSYNMRSVSDTYWELVDYLLFKYYFRGSWGAPQALPEIPLPGIMKYDDDDD